MTDMRKNAHNLTVCGPKCDTSSNEVGGGLWCFTHDRSHRPDPRPPVGTAVRRPDGQMGVVSDPPHPLPKSNRIIERYLSGVIVWVRGGDGVPCGWWNTEGIERLSPWRWAWETFRWQRAIQRNWTAEEHAERLHAHPMEADEC